MSGIICTASFPEGMSRRKRLKRSWLLSCRGLMLYYVLMRDAMTGRDEMDFEDAVVKVSKRQRMIKVTPEILKVVREVLDENG